MNIRPYPPDPRYEVTDDGRVRNVITGHWRKPMIPPSRGYAYVSVRLNGKLAAHAIHRMVLLAFVGPPPSPRHEAAHYNGIKTDNRLQNLRWATRSENIADTIRHGHQRVSIGAANHLTRISDDAVRDMRQRVANGQTQVSVAKMYGVATHTVWMIVKRRNRKHVL